jgi:hypothetical protein
LEDVGPIDVTCAGRSAIVLAGVDMLQTVPQDPDVGVRDFLTQGSCVVCCVQEVCLKPVQWFNGKLDAVACEGQPEHAISINCPVPLVSRTSDTSEHADGMISRASDDPGSGFGGDFNTGLDICDRFPSDLRIRADET